MSAVRRPHSWRASWLLAAALAAMMLGALEVAWRWHGHRPSVVDDDSLWALQRSRVYGPSTVVLTGMSRMQLDFNSAVFHERFPDRKLVRLEAPQRHLLAALYDLTADEDFEGLVIASASIPWMRRDVMDGFEQELDYYRDHFTWNESIDRRLRSQLQSRLASINPLANLVEAITTRLTRGYWPVRNMLVTHVDRSRDGDYTLHSNLAAWKRSTARVVRRQHEEGHLTPTEILWELRKLEPWIERLRARGGDVVFVRLPTGGKLAEADEEFYPKSHYWDRFAEEAAAHTIHYQDVASLRTFVCADDSHLDQRESPAFTRAFLGELDRLGVLRAR